MQMIDTTNTAINPLLDGCYKRRWIFCSNIHISIQKVESMTLYFSHLGRPSKIKVACQISWRRKTFHHRVSKVPKYASDNDRQSACLPACLPICPSVCLSVKSSMIQNLNIMMMNCFCGMVDLRTAGSRISRRDDSSVEKGRENFSGFTIIYFHVCLKF